MRLAEAIRGSGEISELFVNIENSSHGHSMINRFFSLALAPPLRSIAIEVWALDLEIAESIASQLGPDCTLDSFALNSYAIIIDALPILVSGLRRIGATIRDISFHITCPGNSAILLEGIKDLPCLTRLTLREMSLKAADVGKDFCTGLGKTLCDLDLSKNLLGDAGVAAVVDGLIKCYHGRRSPLRILDLQLNNFGPVGGEKVAELLTWCPNLESLNISQCRIGPAAGLALSEAIKSCVQRLRVLNVRGCDLKSEASAALFCSLDGGKVLTSLDIAANAIGDVGLSALSEHVLAKSLTLEELSIDSNEISGTMLGNGLRKSSGSLRELVTTNGKTEVLNVVATLGEIRELRLRKARIGDEEAKAVAGIISSLRHLRILNLMMNRLHAEGVKVISEAMMQAQTIEELSLGHNKFGVEGARIIAENIIKGCRQSLRWLNIYDIEVPAEGVTTIVKAIKDLDEDDCVLRDIYMRAVEGGKEGYQILNAASTSLPGWIDLHLEYP